MNKQLILTLLVMVVIITGGTYADINEGLIGWWMLDEGTGTTVADSSGAGHDGFFVDSTPEWVPGMYGKALKFDGTDKVEILDHQDFHLTDSMSVALWMLPEAEQTNSAKLFIKQKTGQYPYSLQYDDSAQGLFATVNASTRYDTGPHIPNFPGEWAHMCFTFDGSILILYKDGEEVASANTSGQLQQNDLSLSIGCRLDYDQNFNGIIDDVRLFNRALTPEEIKLFMVPPVAAVTDPSPADGVENVPQDVVLSWIPVEATAQHDIYFGTDAQAVIDADITDTTGIYHGRQIAGSYSPPETLEFGETYYWRVDEIGTTPNDTVLTGNLWGFTVELFVYPVTNVVAIASSSEPDKEAENTVNGSGLDDSGLLHTNESVGNMWLSKRGGEQPTWIEFQFDRVQKLYEMWVWNSNDSLEPAIGLGFKDVTIEYSTDGIDYTTLGTTHAFTRAPGEAGYAHNITIDMGNVAAKYVKLTANSNWENILEQYGLSEVRFFSIPVSAREPSPSSGTTDVVLNPVLGWKAGREAASHIVFFSNDLQAVIDGTAQVADVTETDHPLSALDVGTTYYWRIDEVNDAETPSRWQGEIWDFTTVEYLVVDDFESYNDLDPADQASNRIFNAWIDGYDVPTNGSLVGYEKPPFAERTIVHSGFQSMPFSYDNSAGKSEATLTLPSNRDWTANGVGTLIIWYRGNPENAAETMYVVLNGSAGVDNDNPNAAQVTDWTEWNIDLQAFADQGVNLSNVNSITLGLSSVTGGTGMLFFDDIRLYAPAP